MVFIFQHSGLNISAHHFYSAVWPHVSPTAVRCSFDSGDAVCRKWPHAKDFIFLTLSPLVAACSVFTNILHVSDQVGFWWNTVHIFSAAMCDSCNSRQKYVRGLCAVLLLRYAAAVGRLPARSAVPSALRSNPPPARGSCTRSFT